MTVTQWVLLLHGAAFVRGIASWFVEDGLDFSAVDEAGDVGVGDDIRGEEEVFLQGGGGSGAAVDGVEGFKGAGGPDDEAAEMASWSELEEVQGEDRAGLNTGDITECTDEVLAIGLGVVDDEWSTALTVTAATEFTLTGAELAGFLHLDDVWAGTDGLEESDGGGGLDKSSTLESLGRDDKGNFGDRGDAMTAG